MAGLNGGGEPCPRKSPALWVMAAFGLLRSWRPFRSSGGAPPWGAQRQAGNRVLQPRRRRGQGRCAAAGGGPAGNRRIHAQAGPHPSRVGRRRRSVRGSAEPGKVQRDGVLDGRPFCPCLPAPYPAPHRRRQHRLRGRPLRRPRSGRRPIARRRPGPQVRAAPPARDVRCPGLHEVRHPQPGEDDRRVGKSMPEADQAVAARSGAAPRFAAFLADAMRRAQPGYATT